MPDLPPDPIEPPFSDDEVWESLVARLTEDSPRDAADADAASPDSTSGTDGEADGEQAADEQGGDQVSGGVDGEQDNDEEDETSPPVGGAAVLPATPIIVWRGSSGDSDTGREAEDFTPPDPPPLPRTDVFTTAAWVGMLSGPGLLLTAGLVGLQIPGWLGVLAVLAFLSGAGILVARMRDEPPDDDGAVV
jgi:hypothetical protein